MGWMGGGSTPGATTNEKALARTSAKDWNDYVERYIPLEGDYVNRIKDREGDLRKRTGEMSADVASATKGLSSGLSTNELRTGRGVSSGASVLGQSNVASSSASGMSRGLAAAGVTSRNREVTGRLKMAAFGRGLADQNRISMTQAGQRDTNTAISEVELRTARNQQYSELISSGLGAAVGYNRG